MGARDTKLRGWRRFAVALWPAPSDPQMLGDMEIDATAMLACIEELRRTSGVHVTATHLAGRAVAHALTVEPDLNVTLHGDRLRRGDRVDIAFIVTFGAGREQAGLTLADVGRRSAVDVAQELIERAAGARENAEPGFDRAGRLADHLPLRVVRALLRVGVWASVDRGWDLRAIGIQPGGFGSAIVTSLGGMGIDHGYPLLTELGRVPIAIAIGRIADRPVAEDGHVVVRPMLTLSASLDHRYLDGSHAARLAAGIRAYLADPSSFEPAGPVDREVSSTSLPSRASTPCRPIGAATFGSGEDRSAD